jgi:hypothetical protein
MQVQHAEKLLVPCVFALQGSHQCLGQMRTASHPWKFLSAMFIRVAICIEIVDAFSFTMVQAPVQVFRHTERKAVLKLSSCIAKKMGPSVGTPEVLKKCQWH